MGPEYEESLRMLEDVVRTRKMRGSSLHLLFVDEALRPWSLWDTVRDDVDVRFMDDVHSDDM